MTQLETFQNFKVQYVCVKGNPWFRGNDVAEILGYIRPRKAVQDHVPDKYRNTLENLMLASGSTVSGLPDHNDKISIFVSEAGMYKLVLKSKAKTPRLPRIGSVPKCFPPSGRRGATWHHRHHHHQQSRACSIGRITRPTTPSKCIQKTISTSRWSIT